MCSLTMKVQRYMYFLGSLFGSGLYSILGSVLTFLFQTDNMLTFTVLSQSVYCGSRGVADEKQ